MRKETQFKNLQGLIMILQEVQLMKKTVTFKDINIIFFLTKKFGKIWSAIEKFKKKGAQNLLLAFKN